MDVRTLQKLQADPAVFRRSLLIDTDAGPVQLAKVADDYQRQDFVAIDPALRRVARQDVQPQYTRAWLERPRGHSKTTDIAVVVVWLLFSSRRRLSGIAAAADQDQARLLRDGMETLVRLNPWLAKFIEVQKHLVRNPHTGSELTILSSDAASSYGLTPDFIISDELTHWVHTRGEQLWTSLVSSAAKKAHCLLLVICNAGFGDTWQWNAREAIRQDPAWYFHSLDGPRASWITEDRLAEQRRLLPLIAYERLWLNRWSSGSGDALTEDEISTAVSQAGPMLGAAKGWAFVAGVDLSTSRDATALSVVGCNVGYSETFSAPSRRPRGTAAALVELGLLEPKQTELERVHHKGSGRLRLADLSVWKPSGGRKVDLEDVEASIIEAHQRYRLSAVYADVWQAELMLARLRRRSIPAEGVQFTGTACQQMAIALLDPFREKQIDLYDHPALLADLRNLQVVEKSYGFRLQSPRGGNGSATHHGDTATALMLATFAAKRFMFKPASKVEGKLVCYP